MGIGIFSLIIYIVLIFILNMGLKRKMAEALMWAFLALLVISTTLGGKSAPVMFITGVKTVLSQEVTFGVIAFMVMALLMQETGIMKRLISILNCLFGKIPGEQHMFLQLPVRFLEWFPDPVLATVHLSGPLRFPG